MNLLDKDDLIKYDDNQYVWYACYGSNINYQRFIYYINGDTNEKYSTATGCKDKTLPLEERQYIFKHPIYFASTSKKWSGGMAFLDYENDGKSYGKIYKLRMSQFRDILEQEQNCKLYDAILLVDYIDNLPVFTFTAQHKLYDLLNQPSDKYVEVITKGLLELYNNLSTNEIKEYLKN